MLYAIAMGQITRLDSTSYLLYSIAGWKCQKYTRRLMTYW